MPKIVECVPNFSVGRSKEVIELIDVNFIAEKWNWKSSLMRKSRSMLLFVFLGRAQGRAQNVHLCFAAERQFLDLTSFYKVSINIALLLRILQINLSAAPTWASYSLIIASLWDIQAPIFIWMFIFYPKDSQRISPGIGRFCLKTRISEFAQDVTKLFWLCTVRSIYQCPAVARLSGLTLWG